MVNKSILSLTLTLPFTALADDGMVSRSHEVKTFGTRTGAEVAGGIPDGTNSVQANTTVKVLGKSMNALSSSVDADNLMIGDTAYTTVYSFGKRVFSDAFSVSTGGPNNIRLGLAPTEIRVPFVTYPIGPLTLTIGGGARFHALFDATLTPEIGIPLQTSTLGVTLSARALAAGFVEGYGSLVILRGGVGGQVDLVDGQLDVHGRVAFDQSKPVLLVNGIVHFFKGRFYAFLDLFGLLSTGWTRLIDEDLYHWNGKCYSMGHLQCPVN